MFDKNYINAQELNDLGFVKLRENIEQSKVADLKIVDKFVENFKLNGIKLSKDFHNVTLALRNYIIDFNPSNEEINEIVKKINNYVEEGLYASKSNQNAGKSFNGATSDNTKKQEYKNVNDKGFVIVHKPKNEVQESISKLFEQYYNEKILDAGLSKEMINSFNNSRNYFTLQERPIKEINDFLKKFSIRIKESKMEKENNSDVIKELFKRIENLEKENSVLKKQIANSNSNMVANNKTISKDETIEQLSPNEIKRYIEDVVVKRWINIGKENPELKRIGSDYTELRALKNENFKSIDELENKIQKIEESIQNRSEKKECIVGDEIEPDNDSAMKQLRQEYREQQAQMRKKTRA
ncbi:hypothetical protein [Campylobacter sp. US33a]|uniref:hypothetical protein n=1 Tax=Campylobacter sp. US33a TaxID=2498120 RepID=UPI00106876A6|nr:hypothetical protein [Campylobacter sp. US33a]TEX99570.1 hypothetical protein ELQ16_09715 [Campylobacter sp. US33a]